MTTHPAPAIHISPLALATIQKQMARDSRSDLKFRIYIEGGGCSGLRYEYALEDQMNEGDRIIWQGDIAVISDEISIPYLLGATLDYVQDLKGAKFLMHNPNAEMTCGCGASFALKEDS